MNEFFQRLKQRKLVQWVIAYIAAAFALLQGIDIIAQQFGWPEGVRRGITLALVVGFFVTLVIAWYHGERGAQRVSGTELLIIGLVLALGGGFLWRFAATSHAPDNKTAVTPNETEITRPAAAIPEKSIAVLPFENLSEEKSNAFFALGIQDEILTRLAKIGALKVISRSSTQKYKSSPDNLREVGQQLGVANLLEGSVQRAGNAVHINVQLIKATTDAHVWAETYDRELQNIFGVESEVAGKIAEALDAKLSGAEEKSLAAQPTNNVAAYDAYLHGRSIEATRFGIQDEQEVAANYAKAVQLDSNFALAWARLAIVRSFLYFNFVDRTTNSPAVIKEAADRAMALQPELGEAWIAQGSYRYHIASDFTGALAAYAEAGKRLPNSADVFGEMAFVERRMGRWDDAINHFKKAITLDPRNLQLLIFTGECLSYVRRFNEAEEYIDRALQIAPEAGRALAAKIGILQAEGRLNEASKVAARIVVPTEGNAQLEIGTKTSQLFYERQFEAAITQMQVVTTAIKARESLDEWELVSIPTLAYCQQLAGKTTDSRATYTLAVQNIKPSPDATIPIDQAQLRCVLALAYAGLGERDKALAEARAAVIDYQNDAIEKAQAEITLAQVEAHVGEIDAAIAALPHLLEVANGLTPSLLRIDPYWDPLRKDPRFEKLCQEPNK
ncbi:MAG TPA: tetratricopeptide repeat protein [Candidatus Udaeobacter sp.]|jgi:TolB-like protein/Tfp pilus assembly protein PilF|nr:tetratricopeptide repeat protein [Candidatus Udaeobacter sp.]